MNYASNNCVKFFTFFFVMNFEFFDVCKKEKERARGKKKAIQSSSSNAGCAGFILTTILLYNILAKGVRVTRSIKTETKNITKTLATISTGINVFKIRE